MISTKLSIISINLNNSEGLEKTIRSVIRQTNSDFEYIVIDGNSKDGSLNVIKNFDNQITYWVSEPDSGIYNAMNKGISKSTGRYCLFLNSGDWLADENVISDFFLEDFEEDIVSGNIIRSNNYEVRKPPSMDLLDFSLFCEGSLPHQATFIKRELFDIYGFYKENHRIVSDWEFFLKCLVINNCSYVHFDRNIAFFDINGISLKSDMQSIIESEKESVFFTSMPVLYKSYKKLKDENTVLLSHDGIYREYLNFINGKFNFIIKLLFYTKKRMKSIKY